MTKDEFVTLITSEVMGLSSYIDSTDVGNALDDASRETGWAFPVSSNFRIYWIKYRAKRHLFFYLMTESAHKFKIRTIDAGIRFDHYRSAILMMDREFASIQEEQPQEFADVDTYKVFGTKIDAGYSYDPVGKETTYDSEQLVITEPGD